MKATNESASDLLFPLQYRGKALRDVDVMVIGEVDFGEGVNFVFDAQTC